MKRIFLIVLDSLGIGEAPDAEAFGDVGANTLGRISRSGKFNIPRLTELGLGEIDGVSCVAPPAKLRAAVARLCEESCGKDTTVGHFELSGLLCEKPFPTYPNGFPREIIEEFERQTGRAVLCNKPYSGTVVINEYGEEHMKSGALIVYTSADSVFQIAAHEDVVPLEELYRYCRIARKILVGDHAVGRVIARPFVGEAGSFARTANRRDFSVEPPRKTVLDAICESGKSVIAVGKINDIFAGCGISESHLTHGNLEAMTKGRELAERDFSGLCFINLVDFDMLYGHRQDIDGYAAALTEFDAWLSSFLEKLREDDMLIITADHGCDPGDNSTDHTREYVPLLVAGEKIMPENLGTINGFGTVANLVARSLGLDYSAECGEDIYDKIAKK